MSRDRQLRLARRGSRVDRIDELLVQRVEPHGKQLAVGTELQTVQRHVTRRVGNRPDQRRRDRCPGRRKVVEIDIDGKQSGGDLRTANAVELSARREGQIEHHLVHPTEVRNGEIVHVDGKQVTVIVVDHGTDPSGPIQHSPSFQQFGPKPTRIPLPGWILGAGCHGSFRSCLRCRGVSRSTGFAANSSIIDSFPKGVKEFAVLTGSLGGDRRHQAGPVGTLPGYPSRLQHDGTLRIETGCPDRADFRESTRLDRASGNSGR